ncbi:hypothetical protein [Bacillus multifaciens]|uniref:hypothetical protein n=1 Tax=Bacillus multifaciens TaxID=3068506 RepID=UPI0027418D02|nr:hypothetical protein [Bacillus sp. WLY-B-L8]
MSYLKWNDLIASYFFNEEMAGQEVLLFIDKSLIKQLGKKIGENLDDFISSLIEGPHWIRASSNSGICQKALLAADKWRGRKLEYPPYIGYLALFVLAGYVQDENFSQIAYYPKLRNLLGEEKGSGQYPSFDRMESLWKDLEKWSTEDKFEEYGRFKVRIRGRYRHVGLPLSQTIISSRERKRLPLIFNKVGITFYDSPDSETVRKILLDHGEEHFTKKTMRLLKGEEENSELLQALLDLAGDTLVEWDGIIPGDLIDSNSFVHAKLRLCLSLNKLTEKAAFTLRINTQNEFPDEPLTFRRKMVVDTVRCIRITNGWSTELKDNQNVRLDATRLNWIQGEQFEDLENRWKVSLPGAPVRVFMLGREYGLYNLVEVPRIKFDSKFMVLCSSSHIGRVREWLEYSCQGVGELQYTGLPQGWSLFHATNPREPCLGIPALTLVEETKVRFIDGIRLGNGNTFLSTLLPRIMLENNKEGAIVTLGDTVLEQEHESKYWKLPGNLPVDKKLIIHILYQGTSVKKVTFKVIKPTVAISSTKEFVREKGLCLDREEKVNIGVVSLGATTLTRNLQRPLPTHLSNEIIFIGQKLGEIYHWHGRNKVELEWEPIWAIWKAGRKKWKVQFCSTRPLNKCELESQIVSKKDMKHWKSVMCKMRKTIEKPKFQVLHELWNRYLEVAKSVQ